jgi:hypothetical protein
MRVAPRLEGERGRRGRKGLGGGDEVDMKENDGFGEALIGLRRLWGVKAAPLLLVLFHAIIEADDSKAPSW